MSALQLPLAYFLPAYYATHMGLSLGTVGLIFLVTRFWDVITDPLLGVLCDRFPSRFGRRRHWMVASVPILMLGGYMIFMPPDDAGPAHLVGWLFFTYIGWTLLMLAYFAWAAELSSDYDERTRIHGARDTMALIGSVLLFGIPAAIGLLFGHDDSVRITIMGAFFLITLPLTVFVAVTRVPEFKHTPAKNPKMLPPWRSIFQNSLLGRLLFADVLTSIGFTATATMFVFYVGDILDVAVYATTALLFYKIGGTFGIRLWVRMAVVLEKHRALVVGKLIMIAMLPIFLILPKGNGIALIIFMSVYGIALSSSTILLRTIAADVVDVDHLEGGQERTGFYYALLTMASKTGMALAVGITFGLLDLIGFEPGQANSPEALWGMSAIFVGTPLIAYLVAAAVMWNFPLGRERQKAVRREIDRKQSEAVLAPAHSDT